MGHAERVGRRSGPAVQQVLYLTQFGNREQLRVRALPYPGGERVLWGSPDVWGVASIFPSPTCRQVAALWQELWQGAIAPGGRNRVFLIPIAGGKAEEIVGQSQVDFLLWRDEHTLALLARDGSEWAYDLTSGKRRFVRRHADVLSFLEPPYAKQIAVLRQVLEDGGVRLPIRPEHAPYAILRGAGFLVFEPLSADLQVARPVAALAPDEKYLAVSSGEKAVSIICIAEHESSVVREIPLTESVDGERVTVEHLRWSTDSNRLTFTEVHYHPPKAYAPDIHVVGERGPDPLDSTYLVRMYTLATDEASTPAVGRNAVLLPETGRKPTSDR